MASKVPVQRSTDARRVEALWLGEDIGLAQELGPFFRERGLDVSVTVADERSSPATADLALAYFPDPAGAGGVLCAATSLRTLVWPPLVAIVARNPSRGDLERMRRQGVVHVCREIDGTFGNVVKRLVDPSSCGRWKLAAGLLADALTSAERTGASGMLCVCCPHWAGASSYPWENSSLFYCGEGEGGKCSGWAGRIYLVGGVIMLAETPQARGIHALHQMLQLREGTVMRYPFYLSPDTTEPLGPASAAVASASARGPELTETARVDELRRTEPAGKSAPVPAAAAPPPRPELPRPQGKEPAMSDLDKVLAGSPAYAGAARLGLDGLPLAAAGDIDLQMVSAVVQLAGEHVQGVAAALPLGSVLGFSVGGRQAACFVRYSAKSRSTLVVKSGATQTPNRTLAELGRQA